jgi:uncharacterized protein (DUF1800 family)
MDRHIATKEDIALMAHLMRRAGFGASRKELELLVAAGYDETVENLLDFDRHPEVDEYSFYRDFPMMEVSGGGPALVEGQSSWLYRMRVTERPLEEKMVLFWHQVFATGHSKVDNCYEQMIQLNTFRRYSLGNFRDLLVQLAQDPAMIFWLDNNENHSRAPNENWGRELLELFSMGVASYTEGDVKAVARAFTGWTIGAKIPRNSYGREPWCFEYKAEDHDGGDKRFLGHRGKLNGEDIIDVIVGQPACAKFLARHLYNYFVADEPPIPSWPTKPPQDPEAVEFLAETLLNSGYEIKQVMRTLLKSEFFKNSLYRKVRSPVEVVVGTLKMTGEFERPLPGLSRLAAIPGNVGQSLLDPPTVEGWHTGKEWINSGSLSTRVNFVGERVSNVQLAGVRDIVNRVAGDGYPISPEGLVERCLDQMGPLNLNDDTHYEILQYVEREGPVSWTTAGEQATSARRVGETLALIAATKEYQFG